MGKANRNKKKVGKLGINKKVPSKKQLLSIYTLETLLAKAQDEIDTFNYEEAQGFCQEALKRDPDNLKALEISSNLCIETGNIDGAKHCLGRAITLSPEIGFSKYLSMGQLLEGKDSLQCYLKGIEIINKAMKKVSKCQTLTENLSKNNLVNGKNEENSKQESEKGTELENSASTENLSRKLSNAYCAVAELFMSDLCDEEMAETESLTNIQKAISSDETNPEAYLHFANFLLIKEDLEEAKKNVKKSVSLWLPKYNEVEAGEAGAGSFDPVDVCPLTQSVRFFTCRILIELEEYELAADILEGLLGEDDEVIYTWYLLGWNHYLQGEGHEAEAKEHFEKALELNKSCPASDSSIIDHAKELLIELKDVKTEPDETVDDLEREIEELEVS